MYTNKERSLRLKELGFLISDVTTHTWIDFNNPFNNVSTKRYSTEVLLNWLREKYHSDPNFALDIQPSEITIWLNIGHNPDEEEKEFPFQDSLANMLADAIIFILEMEMKR